MHVCRTEPRGGRVWEQAGVTHIRITKACNAGLSLVKPDLVLDVGANYGGIAFSGHYWPYADVVLVEANPNLTSYLRQSIGDRCAKSGGRWHCLEATASDEPGYANFFIDSTSSGSSHLTDSEVSPDLKPLERVELIRLDQISIAKGKKRILFKLDVEDAKVSSLKGLTALLNQVEEFIGIVEMRDANLKVFNTSSSELWSLAQELGYVAVFDEFDKLVDCTGWDYEKLLKESKTLNLRVADGADLIISSEVLDLERLSVPPWLKTSEAIVKKLIPKGKSSL